MHLSSLEAAERKCTICTVKETDKSTHRADFLQRISSAAAHFHYSKPRSKAAAPIEDARGCLKTPEEQVWA